jgi:exonuclease SbcC
VLPREEELNSQKEDLQKELSSCKSVEEIEKKILEYEKKQNKLLQEQTSLSFEMEKQKKAQSLVAKKEEIERSLESIGLSSENNLEDLLAESQKEYQEALDNKKQLESKQSLEKRLQQFGNLEDFENISYTSLKEDLSTTEDNLKKCQELLPKVLRKNELNSEFSRLSDKIFSLDHNTVSEDFTKKDEHYRSLSAQLTILQTELKKLLALRDKSICPTCLQPISKESHGCLVATKEKERETLQKDVDETKLCLTSLNEDLLLIKKCEELTTELESLPDGDASVLKTTIEAYKEKIKHLNNLSSKIVQISSIKDQLAALPATFEFTLEEVSDILASLGERVKVINDANNWLLRNGNVVFDLNEMSRIQNNLNEINTSQKETIENIVTYKGSLSRIEQIKKQLIEIDKTLDKSRDDRNRLRVLETIHFVLGDMRKAKLKESTELLTTVLPENIKRLFPKGHTNIEVTSESGEFDLYLTQNGIKYPMDSLSGGQEKRVGLAIVFAFAKMGSKLSNLLIADEIFKDLDPPGRKYVYELLMDLNMDTILVTSHDNDLTMKSKFNQVWTMRMQNGKAKLYK